MSRRRVVVAGSLNADLSIRCQRLPLAGETLHGSGFAVGPGGKGANQAVAASRLGAAVTLIGAVGDDANGAMLLASAAGAGVDVSRVRRAAEPTGVAVITVDAAGENTIVIAAGANAEFAPADVRDEAFADCAVLTLALEVPIRTVLRAAQAARARGAQVLLNLSPYAEIPQALVDLTDILLVNAREAAQFLGTAAIPEAAAAVSTWQPWVDAFARRGLGRVLLTLGARGAMVLDASAAAPVTAIPANPVAAIDTTGAGDAFTGAVAARLAAGDGLVDAARYASVAAAIATTRRGTQSAYANAAEVGALMQVRRAG